ncbi:MAG: hypothetical protein H3C43_02015 [Leptonema sp. (in: Bacteria)]|nr:hypothetical protein [Leptonema sp. (in: bacteria)]
MQTKVNFIFRLTIFYVFVASCSIQLKQPKAPPDFWPDGLWLKNGRSLINEKKATDHFELLRIICNDSQCWFRSTVLYYRKLPISGLVFNKTERSGYIETSVNELLLMQTEFKSERIEWPNDSTSKPKSMIDRVVHGESKFRLFNLNFENQTSIESDGDVFDRQCNQDCKNPIALLLPLSNLNKQLVISPDSEFLGSQNLNWPTDLQPNQKTELMFLAESDLSIGRLPVSTKSKIDLATVFESQISFTPGSKALELRQKRQRSVDAEKQKRIDDIKQRLKDGKPVSREEMLEILD